MNKGNTLLYVVIGLLLLGLIGGGAFLLGRRTSSSSSPVLPGVVTSTSPTTTQQTDSLSPTTSQQTKSNLFEGKVTKLSSDLQLFKVTENDVANGTSDYFVYFSAGTYAKGEFAGYTRIIAIRPAEGPGPSMQYILATKDYKSYLLDDPMDKTTKYAETDWENPYLYIDKSKISKAVTLETDHPARINLEKPFALIKQETILTENKAAGKKDKNGNDIYLDYPITEVDTTHLLTTSQSQLSIYSGGTNWGDGKGYTDTEKKLLEIRKKYLSSSTFAHAVDSTGLTYSYILAPQADIDAYQSQLPTYEQSLIDYKKQVALFEAKKLSEYPKSPQYLTFPGMRVTKAQAGLPDGYYNTYDVAFPGACGGNQSTFIVDGLKDEDLVVVSSTSSFPLYTLTDSNHPLYDLAYASKSGYDEESFKMSNDGKSRPTINEYVSKHPLLFFKDAWGRWGVMGEFDIKLMGGCGKPVVYLYPEQPTTVHLSFTSPVSLDTQIPTYHDGWLVKAQPDGTLTDLQSRFTDCSLIDSARFGSEYARDACENNVYPYIYWSGKSVEKNYPAVDGGWVVRKEDLATFMSAKLSEMGLTRKESSDMISYWVPKMSEKNTPYYRVSFFQTREMNEFIPMDVSPRPDTVLRVFLDYTPLSSKPAHDLVPQQLQRVERTGFTLVEWGGLR